MKTKKKIPIDIEKRIKKSREMYSEKRKTLITDLETLEVYTFFEKQWKGEISKKDLDLILFLKTRRRQSKIEEAKEEEKRSQRRREKETGRRKQ